jgi:tRNA/tmRNA/rRNA uracil-C5-methylase (TrmA/RlmC/RlmD family)
VQPGDLIGPVEIGPVAHGGHCVARVDGRVVFVRHVLPGEVVRARVTEVSSRFARADAVEIVRSSPERIQPPCPHAGVCGGCDFQHVRPEFQAELKRRVLAEQLQRLAGIECNGVVEQVPPLLGSRVRMRFVATDDGRLGLRAHRSHVVVPLPVDGCRIAHPLMPATVEGGEVAEAGSALGSRQARSTKEPLVGEAGAASGSWQARSTEEPQAEVIGVVSLEGGRLVGAGSPGASEVITQRVGERTFSVNVNGFWQSHLAAPEVLTAAVLEGLAPSPGETAFDLYCGVGVFAAALIDADCRVWGIEGSRTAVAHARHNVPQASFFAGDVGRTLRRLPKQADLVVLDPPRTGAGAAVMTAVTRLRPRAIAYVACDPAALARDLGTARASGYEASSIRGFDVFGMTHHIEAVAVLRR